MITLFQFSFNNFAIFQNVILHLTLIVDEYKFIDEEGYENDRYYYGVELETLLKKVFKILTPSS